MKFKTAKPLALALGLTLAAPAFAQRAGDTILGVGVAFIAPSAGLGPTSSSNPTFPAEAAGFNAALAGTKASIADATTASFSLLHLFTDNIGAELTLGVPPKLKVSLDVPVGTTGPVTLPNAATAKALTPALVAKYFFLDPSSAFRPYVGLGFTYATFQDVTPNANQPLTMALAGKSAKLSSEVAPIYNLGVVYNIDDKWSINTSVAYIALEPRATLVGVGNPAAPGDVTTRAKLKINPTDYIIRIGYKF